MLWCLVLSFLVFCCFYFYYFVCVWVFFFICDCVQRVFHVKRSLVHSLLHFHSTSKSPTIVGLPMNTSCLSIPPQVLGPTLMNVRQKYRQAKIFALKTAHKWALCKGRRKPRSIITQKFRKKKKRKAEQRHVATFSSIHRHLPFGAANARQT